MRQRVMVGMLLMVVAGTASAQSLADVARQEASRRLSIVASGRVYTNADLPVLPPEPVPVAVTSSPLPQTGAEPVAPPEATAASFDDRDERYWRDRGSALSLRVESARADVAAVKANLDAPTVSSLERTLTEAALRTVEADLRALEDDWQELQAQASAAKVPLFWLR